MWVVCEGEGGDDIVGVQHQEPILCFQSLIHYCRDSIQLGLV